jgi:hypothetical protein
VGRWYTLLIVFMLAGCGQPLQISTPSQTQTQSTRPPDATVLPEIPANGVPSATPPEQVTPELGVTPAVTFPVEPPSQGTAAPTLPVVVVVPQTQAPVTNEQRWRAQQQDRKVNDPPRVYVARIPVTLWWYDPLVSQSVQIGTIRGEFPVQAEFVLRGGGGAALEVPYVINSDFGLTAISEAVRERMRAAGYSQSVEAYVLRTDDTQPK